MFQHLTDFADKLGEGIHAEGYNEHIGFLEDVSILSLEVTLEWDDGILQKTPELGIMKGEISNTNLTQSQYLLECSANSLYIFQLIFSKKDFI